MIPALFLQSEIKDPYAQYERMLQKQPVYWDSVHCLWAIYSYEGCRSVLCNPEAFIPQAAQQNQDGLNEHACAIIDRLARLSNGPRHEAARQAVMLLFEYIRTMDIEPIVGDKLLKETDWADTVCKHLPVMMVAQCFGMSESDSRAIADSVDQLVAIMLPARTAEQVKGINAAATNIYCITEKHLLQANFYKDLSGAIRGSHPIGEPEIAALLTGNLVGLFIQSYDAGRGLLGNALLQMLRNESLERDLFTHPEYVEKIVVETLRFDPPVQHTRRVATADMEIHGTPVKKGDTLLLVLAAANRDPARFALPGIFNVERNNNHDHLTFGAGGHRCPAGRFAAQLAGYCLSYLFCRFNNIQLLDRDISYEPLMNVRIPKHIFITLQKGIL